MSNYLWLPKNHRNITARVLQGCSKGKNSDIARYNSDLKPFKQKKRAGRLQGDHHEITTKFLKHGVVILQGLVFSESIKKTPANKQGFLSNEPMFTVL